MGWKRFLVEYLSVIPFSTPKVALYRKLGARIGNRVSIGRGSFVWSPNFQRVNIGDGVTIRDNTKFFCDRLTVEEDSYVERDCFVSGSEFFLGFGSYFGQRMFVDCTQPVRIGAEVIISYTNIYTHEMNYTWATEGRVRRKSGPVIIDRRASLAPGIHIAANVKIGEHSIVGSGSVVLKDVAPYTLNAGVPCRELRSIREYFENRQDILSEVREDLERYIRRRYSKERIRLIFDKSFGISALQDMPKGYLFLVGNSVDNKVFSTLRCGRERRITAFDLERQIYYKSESKLVHEIKHRMRRFGLVFKPYGVQSDQ
jgi:acetyltransferase-like isoleucine patch superfamily enzyme